MTTTPDDHYRPRKDGFYDAPGAHDDIQRGMTKFKYAVLGFVMGIVATFVGFVLLIVQAGQAVLNFFTGLF